jgi:hypothetical protein
MPLSMSLTPSLLLVLGYAASKVRSGDSNARRFVFATSPLIATMAVSAFARIIGSSYEAGAVQSLILLCSVFMGVMLAIALAQHIQVLSATGAMPTTQH